MSSGPGIRQSQSVRTAFPLPALSLAQHWSADAGISAVNGGPVTSWKDTVTGLLLTPDVAHDVTQTPPTYLANVDADGMPLVRFNGTTDQLANVQAGVGYGGEELTFFLVSRCIRDTSHKRKIMALCAEASGDESGNGSMYVGADEPDAYRLRYNIPPTANSQVSLSAPRVENGLYINTNVATGVLRWQIHCYRFSRVMGFAYWQLQVRIGQVDGQWSMNNTTFNQTYDSLYLGSGSTGGIGWPNNMQCDVRELGIYHRGLRDDEMGALLQYAGNKWLLPGLK